MKITVFTPTYNRAYTLNKLYMSLCNQKYNNFEWIVVDDGSNDNTKEIILNWKKEKKIDIKYYYQKNSGKHIAINNGIKKATGELFIIVDSDDFLTDNALDEIINCFSTINELPMFAGIGGTRIHMDGSLIGTTFKENFVDATSLERRKYNINGDKAEVFYTKILKKYEFPQIEDEKFVSEAYIWNKIAADGYKIRWFNKPFIVCEYLNDGLTKNNKTLIEKNPKGHLLYILDLIKFEKSPIRKLAHKCSFYRYGKQFYSNKEIMNKLEIGRIQLFVIKTISKIRG